MKLGIITLYYNNNNYGGVAQAYALCKYFRNLGYESELITYNKQNTNLNLVNKNKNLRMILHRGVGKIKRTVNIPIEKILSKNYNGQLQKRYEKLEKFRNSIPHSKVYAIDNIDEISNKYDIFVTGSDQVWNPGVVDNAFVFSCLNNLNRNIFSYASSVAVTEVTEKYKDFMKKELKKYSEISVREQQSQSIIQELTNKKVEWVVDPTLLLTRQEWNSLIKDRIIKEKYVFSYMLGNSKKQRKLIKKFAKQNNLTLVTVPYIKNGAKFEFKIEDYKFGDIQMLDISFEDFLNLIKYSECVVTDSFHAICFSYIFKKEFYALEKESVVSTSSRIYSLLRLFGCTDRIIKEELKLSNNVLDYKLIDNNIMTNIEESRNYIKKTLDKFNGGK